MKWSRFQISSRILARLAENFRSQPSDAGFGDAIYIYSGVWDWAVSSLAEVASSLATALCLSLVFFMMTDHNNHFSSVR